VLPRTFFLLAALVGACGLGLFARADHGAPASRLGSVTLCVAPSSVQLTLEPPPRVAESQIVERVREAVLETLRGTLSAHAVPFETDCERAQGFVLLTLYARFLDPETYLGFPPDSYAYVSSAQVGAFVGAAGPETALPGGRYSASASDIVQAPTAAALEARLVALGEAQSRALARAWREANAPTGRAHLSFAGLGLLLAVLRALPLLDQRPRR